MQYSKIYLEALLSAHSSVSFDGFNGKTFSFEKLFHPFEIDEGKYAIQSHRLLMDRAKNELSVGQNKISQPERAPLSKKQKAILDIVSMTDRHVSNPSRYFSYLKKKTNLHDVIKALDGAEHRKKSVEQSDGSSVPKIQTETEREQKYKNAAYSELDKIVAESKLTLETECEKSSLVINKSGIKSRVLAVASAGQGKTTLLKRIAVFYCRESLRSIDVNEFEYESEHKSVKEKYKLPELQLLPCILFLRSINRNFDIKEAINTAIVNILKKGMNNTIPDTELSTNAQAIYNNAVSNNRFLLLLDGLDELSDSDRKKFLEYLDSYLCENPDIYVLMSSRAAGLTDENEEVKRLLGKMNFRGRSIIPMDEKQVESYSHMWIDETQPESFRYSMKNALEQVLHQDRFGYLKEFMCTPLELLFVLKQIASNALSLDRYQMFADMLWEMFTNHESSNVNKQYIFEDYMTLLGFIAYKLQLENKLTFSIVELKKYEDELRYLSFHDKVFGEDIVEGCISFFDDLAANVGIIDCDKQNNEKIYTFTIRSYHEFLTAYACCHLCLGEDKTRPNPQGIVEKYLSDSSWINIINFVLSDLYKHSKAAFESCLEGIFQKTKNTELLKSIIDANHIIGFKHIKTLCNNMFSSRYMDLKSKEFLISCLNSNIASTCYKYLISLYNNAESDGAYLEATAIASVVFGQFPASAAISYLEKKTPTGEKDKLAISLGTAMITNIVKICFDEFDVGDKKDFLYENLKSVDCDNLAELLYNCAIDTKESSAIEALANLWIAKFIGTDTARRYLNEELVEILVPDIRIMLLRYSARNNPDYVDVIKNRLIILGSFPFNEKFTAKANFAYLKDSFGSFITEIYKTESRSKYADCIAVAVADYYCTCDMSRFKNRWCVDICGYSQSYLITAPSSKNIVPSKRVNNHFELIKQSLWKYEDEYFAQQKELPQMTNDSKKALGGHNKASIYPESGITDTCETDHDDDSSEGD